MRFPVPLLRARLICRYKRFLADVAFDDGREETIHVPNPGSMLGLANPGLMVWVSRGDSKTRKLPHTLELVELDGGVHVGVNTLLANRLVAEALAENRIPELSGYASIRREMRYGENSRIDFLLEAPGRPPCWLEVKSVTLSRRAGLAEWPDCVSARATRHVAEMEAMAARGDRAVVLFLAQRGDCERFEVAADLDPAFAQALKRAFRNGVQALCYGCEAGPRAISLDRRLSWPAPE